MAQCGCRDADGLGELECDGAFAVGNGEDIQKTGNQEDVRDRTRAQIASVEKEKSWTTTREVGAELALSRNLKEKTSIETRETFGKDQRRVPR